MKKNTYIKLIAIVMMSFLPTLLHSQQTHSQKEYFDNLMKTAPWLDETSFEKLQAITEWQELEREYDESKAEIETLNKTVKSSAAKMTKLRHKLNEQQKQFSSLYNDIHKGREKEIYLQYDTAILIFHKGLCDSNTERIQKALLVCHRAEKVLSARYDKRNVDKARIQLKEVKDDVPELYNSIDNRLAKYGELTNALRNALTEASDELPKSDEDLSQYMIQKKQKRFFDKLGKDIYQKLKKSDEFPFLYAKLTEAMEAVMDDQSNDISKIIKEL